MDDKRMKWLQAVALGETTLGLAEWSAAQATPELAPAEEAKPEREYGLRFWATARVCYETTVMATCFDEAITKAKEMELDRSTFEVDDAHFEGDETVSVYGPSDEEDDETVTWGSVWEGDGHDVDLRAPGEPFSWAACAITKQLAKMAGQPLDMDVINDLVMKAVHTCSKHEEGPGHA